MSAPIECPTCNGSGEITRFGDYVRAMRLRKGWKQVYLAARAGVTQRTIQYIEAGQSEGKPSTRSRLRQALES